MRKTHEIKSEIYKHTKTYRNKQRKADEAKGRRWSPTGEFYAWDDGWRAALNWVLKGKC